MIRERILVIGASGQIGVELTLALRKMYGNNNVVASDLREENELLKGTTLGKTMKDNAWFVGFAPRQSPEIVVVCLLEAGLHGDMAAPPVRDVIKAYFDKKLRKEGKQLASAGQRREAGQWR